MRTMKLALAVIGAVSVGTSARAAVTVTKVICSFDQQPWTSGPIGVIPCGLEGVDGQTACKWKYQYYGPPAWTSAEQTRVFDGPMSFAWKLPFANIPEKCGTGAGCYAGTGVLLWDVRHPLDWFVAPRSIDWSQPITLSVAVNGYDPSVGGTLRAGVNISNPTTGTGLSRTTYPIEWGDNGETNHEWRVATCVINSNQDPTNPNLDPTVGIKPVLFIDFAVLPTDTGEAEIFFDKLTITYTPVAVPEVCDNGQDDDVDGLIDCDDPDCNHTSACPCNMDRPFDMDFDTDVDQVDFAFFQRCIAGTPAAFEALSLECKCMDRTGPLGQKDSLVDSYDLISLMDCASGPQIAAALGCGD